MTIQPEIDPRQFLAPFERLHDITSRLQHYFTTLATSIDLSGGSWLVASIKSTLGANLSDDSARYLNDWSTQLRFRFAANRPRLDISTTLVSRNQSCHTCNRWTNGILAAIATVY